MTRERLLDSEERNSLARGAMEGLNDLLTSLAPNTTLDAEKLSYLFRAVKQTVDDALQLPCDIGGSFCNDD